MTDNFPITISDMTQYQPEPLVNRYVLENIDSDSSNDSEEAITDFCEDDLYLSNSCLSSLDQPVHSFTQVQRKLKIDRK